MNFKPTQIKSIVAFFVALIIGIIAYTSSGCFDCTKEMIQSVKLQATTQGFIISILVIYIIWSFFDKKK